MIVRLFPLSPIPNDASELERHLAEQEEKIVQNAKAGQFNDMPAQQQRLERLKLAVRAERLAAAKRTKPTA